MEMNVSAGSSQDSWRGEVLFERSRACVRSCPLSTDAEASMASGGFPVLIGCLETPYCSFVSGQSLNGQLMLSETADWKFAQEYLSRQEVAEEVVDIYCCTLIPKFYSVFSSDK